MYSNIDTYKILIISLTGLSAHNIWSYQFFSLLIIIGTKYIMRFMHDDWYDFYFADKENHCIRILTPDGVVSTFAGRGSASASSYKWGKQNGEVRERARFNQPVALAYDEVTKTFYVGDSGNYKIRKIAKEQASDDLVGEESNDNQDQENQ